MSKNRAFWLPALLMLAAAAVTSCGGGEGRREVQAGQPSAPALVEKVEIRRVEASYEAVGTVRSRLNSVLSSRVMGQVLAVQARAGDRVKAGQVLAQIDNRDAQAGLSKAKAGLSEAQNALQEVDESLRAAEAAKAAADAAAALATSTYKRFQALLERKSVSPQEFEEVEFRYRAALAEARRADQTLLASQARRRQVLDRIEQAKADVKNAEAFLSYASVTAPYAGLITARHLDAGAMSAPGMPLFTLEDDNNYQLEASVEESQIGRIHIGDRAPVVVDALGRQELAGIVSEIVPSGDPSSRSFLVKIRLPRTPGLRSGMFGRARFAGSSQEVLAVPESALVRRGQLTGVIVLDEAGRARFRLVKPGKRYGDRVEILSGLEPGERVVLEGLDRIPDGSRVSVMQQG
ncbi:MAG: efflux RND transporter periplasmic adaptor subunit [Acidobacteriota bacterium]